MITKCLGMLILAAAVVISSCVGRPANVQSSPTNASKSENSAKPSARAQVALVDGTGSYGELVPVLNRLGRFASEELNAGDTFCAFWIKGGIGESPDFIVEPTTLPVAQRRIGDPAEVEALKLRYDIQKAFSNYAAARKFKKAGETDLLQAITYAARMLRTGTNAPKEKWLLIFTDLEDNQRKEVSLNLEAINLRVFYVPARNDLKAMDKKIADWSERFKQANAASVEVYDVGQSQTLPRLIANE
jgi:hypothetical protein